MMKVKWGNMEMVIKQAEGLLLTRRSGTQRRAGDEIISVNGLPYNNYSSDFLKYNQDSILNAQLNRQIINEDGCFLKKIL